MKKNKLQEAIDKINAQDKKIKEIKTKGKDPIKVLDKIRQS